MTDLSTINLSMQIMLLIWLVAVFRIIRHSIAEGSVGLPAALALAMTFLYGGCFVYAVPGYTHLRADGNPVLLRYAFSEWTVVQGTFASLLAILGFALGTGVFRQHRSAPNKSRPASRTPERKVLLFLVGFGVLGFLVNYLDLTFPMSGALNELARNVGIAAICLGSYFAWRDGKSLVPWIFLAALVPLYYFVLFGFASYGLLFGIILGSFWYAKLRKRRERGLLASALFGFGGTWVLLTVFVGWFSFRDQFRDVIWAGEGGSILPVLSKAIAKTELFSPWNFASLDLVNIRLNLPIFIGKMIERHTLYPDLREYGDTLINLPLVIVPRFLWPDKPERGGSGFMTEHTGIILSENATFGTGTVFEFYINFGCLGVFIGFIVLGWIIRRLDSAAYKFLIQGKIFDFVRLFVVGIVAIDPLLRPFFIVNGAVLAWILMTILKIVLVRLIGSSRPQSGMQVAYPSKSHFRS